MQRRSRSIPPPPNAPYDEVLDLADRYARAWLDSVRERPIPPRAGIDAVMDALGRELPEYGESAADVVTRLAEGAEPGLIAIGSPRFYGWVIGGTQPVALAADWLVSDVGPELGPAHDRPGRDRRRGDRGGVAPRPPEPARPRARWASPPARRRRRPCAWPRRATRCCGGRAGTSSATAWPAAPRIRFIVGDERHGTVDLAGRYLGLGEPIAVASDEEGRIRVDALREELAAGSGPAIVVLQAGNIHSGAYDDFLGAIAVAHDAGAWVHIDGAFGLWAAASPRLRHLVAGMGGADSWSTDAHKTLSVPYDCGIAIVRNGRAMTQALSMHASYLQALDVGADPHEKVLELSRRARGVPTWAVLRSLGRTGIARLVEQLAGSARIIADGLARLPGVEVLNDVVFTQVCIALESDAATEALSERLWADGEVLAMTSRWHDRAVVRFSVSNWGTDAAQATRTVEVVARTLAAMRAGR